MDKETHLEEPKDTRNLSALVLEILLFFIASASRSSAFTVSMLPVLKRAAKASDARCQFALSWKFLLVYFCYFSSLWFAYSYIGISVDWFMVSIQIVAFLFLICLVFGSRDAIVEGVRRILVLVAIVFRIEPEAEISYRDFLPEFVTPPPNL
jgi:hypothetical protein